MRLRHAARAFVVVDPAQDYEESNEIWGVYGSLAAAKIGVRRGRAAHFGGIYRYLAHRNVEVQRWQGNVLTDVWTHDEDGRWTHRPGPGATPPPGWGR